MNLAFDDHPLTPTLSRSCNQTPAEAQPVIVLPDKHRSRARLNLRTFRSGVLGMVFAAFYVIAGCSDQGYAGLLRFVNHSDRVIDVYVLYPDTGHEFDLAPGINPGQTSATRSDVYPGDNCSDRGVFIARDQQGREVARRSGRFCRGDTWVISDDPLRSTRPSG